MKIIKCWLTVLSLTAVPCFSLRMLRFHFIIVIDFRACCSPSQAIEQLLSLGWCLTGDWTGTHFVDQLVSNPQATLALASQMF